MLYFKNKLANRKHGVNVFGYALRFFMYNRKFDKERENE